MRQAQAILRLAAAAGMLLAARPLAAQGVAQQPFRALFGGDASARRSLHQIDFTATLTAGVDDNAYVATAPDTPDGDAGTGDRFSELYVAGAQLAYTLQGRDARATVSAYASYPYYSFLPEQTDTPAYGFGAGADFTERRTSFNVRANYDFSPFYTPALSPGYGPPVPGGPFDFASALSANERASGGVSVSRMFGRETTALAGYTVDATHFEFDDRDDSYQSANAGIEYQLSRHVNVGGVYSYTSAGFWELDAGSESQSHNADARLAYSKPLARGRNIGFNLGAGFSQVEYNDAWTDGWRGSVGLNYGFRPQWSAGAQYSRSLSYWNATQMPVWSDWVSATLSGWFGRRVSVSLTAAYYSGQDVAGQNDAYDTYSAAARLQWALASFAALTADFVAFRYDYPPGYNLPAGMPSQFDRRRLQVGATFWAPIFRAGRAREPRARSGQ
jgi:hypothetical protein